MSAKQFIIDATTRRQVLLQRFYTGEVRNVQAELASLEKDIVAIVRALDLASYGPGAQARLNAEILDIMNEAVSALTNTLSPRLKEFSIVEAEFMAAVLQDTVSREIATPTAIRDFTEVPLALRSGKSTKVLSYQSLIDALADGAARDVTNLVTVGLNSELTTPEIVDNVERAITTRTRQQIEAVVRTTANHASTNAHNALNAENADVISHEEFLATLDSHTTIICSSTDGKTFAPGVGPMPPLHFNCRSIRVPVPNPEFTLVDLSGERSSQFGPVKNQNFSSWLRSQSSDFRDEYFKQFKDGAEKAKLFNTGKLSLSKFTDNRAVEYTLDELKALNPLAFSRARLDI